MQQKSTLLIGHTGAQLQAALDELIKEGNFIGNVIRTSSHDMYMATYLVLYTPPTSPE